MTDIVDPATRSRMMAGIRAKHTRPEMLIRRALHAQGLRFRLHGAKLPGSPDIIFPRHRAVAFVNGCFWHFHDCHLFKLPATRREFWQDKLSRNRQRDADARIGLEALGWRHLTIWECALRGRCAQPFDTLISAAAGWVREGSGSEELRGTC